MPEDSYRLILDGGPISDKTSEVFRIAQRDVAWQTALDICYSRGLLPTPSWFDRRLQVGYIREIFPRAIRDIENGRSIIRCNFDLGLPYAPEKFVERYSGRTANEWKANWATHEPAAFQTAPPLPSWHLLRWRRVLP
jgi:hypothetical protein